MSKPLNVLINAQLIPGGRWGGVEQFLLGLVHGLRRLSDSDEEYILITDPRYPDWVKSHLGPNQKIVVAPLRKAGRLERAKQLLGPLGSPAGKLWQATRRLVSQGPREIRLAVRESHGFLESLGGHVIHFPFQQFIRCRLPAIYNPHDLKHLHYPQFYSAEVIRRREKVYRAACNQAQAVATASEVVKRDLVKQFGLDSRKVFVIVHGSPTVFYDEVGDEDLLKVRDKFGLPERFAFYPAKTWPHKNHLRLLEAISLLRDRYQVCLNLVCTGFKDDHWPSIERRLGELKLNRQVSFLGYVSRVSCVLFIIWRNSLFSPASSKVAAYL